MATLYWNLDSGTVSSSLSGQSSVQFQATRGSSDLRLILVRGDVSNAYEVLLDASEPVGIAIRDPSALQNGYLGGPSYFTRGATADDGYIGTTSTDTSIVRGVMRVGLTDGTAELLRYDGNAVFFYEPDDGGPHVESLPFTWTILPNYYRPGTPPAEIVATWSSPAQLQAAIAAAAAAEPRLPVPTANNQFLFGNADGTKHFGPFPAGLAPSFASVTASGTLSVAGAVTLSSALGLAGAATLGGTLAVAGAATLAGTLAVANAATFGAGVTVTGALAAASFAGSGAGLTNLDATQLTGTIPLARLPAAIVGSLHYKGTWNAATNTPPLTNGTGEIGAYYIVSTSGPTGVDGVNVWTAGDWIVFDGGQWDKIDGAANPVSSVAGRTGAITLAVADVAGAASLAGCSFSGAVSLPAGSSVAGYALLTGAAFTGPVSATSFFGSGAGLTNVVPFHTTATAPFPLASGSGNSFTFEKLSDVSGTFTLHFNTAQSPNAAVATITFGTPYPTLPNLLMFIKTGEAPTPVGNLVATFATATVAGVVTAVGLNIAVDANGTNVGSVTYQYFISQQ